MTICASEIEKKTFYSQIYFCVLSCPDMFLVRDKYGSECQRISCCLLRIVSFCVTVYIRGSNVYSTVTELLLLVLLMYWVYSHEKREETLLNLLHKMFSTVLYSTER